MRTPAASLFTATLLIVCAGFLWMTARFEPAARIVPLSVLLPLIGLVALQLARELRAPLMPADTTPDGIADAGTAEPEAAPMARSEGAALGWIALLGLLIVSLGLPAGTALFVLVYLRRGSGERWIFAIAGGVASALGLCLILSNVLGAPVSAGAVGSLFRALIR
jgi:hypothetical protein